MEMFGFDLRSMHTTEHFVLEKEVEEVRFIPAPILKALRAYLGVLMSIHETVSQQKYVLWAILTLIVTLKTYAKVAIWFGVSKGFAVGICLIGWPIILGLFYTAFVLIWLLVIPVSLMGAIGNYFFDSFWIPAGAALVMGVIFIYSSGGQSEPDDDIDVTIRKDNERLRVKGKIIERRRI
jgi:hypothetical protein